MGLIVSIYPRVRRSTGNPCMFSMADNVILGQAGGEGFCGAAQPRKKNRSQRPAADRRPCGVKNAVAQRDRGRSGIVSPNSRQSRTRRAASSSRSQGRDGSMMHDAVMMWIGIDVAKASLDVAWG